MVKISRAILVAALAVCLLAAQVRASTYEWARLGPLFVFEGRQPFISAIATLHNDPAVLYAGVFRTTTSTDLVYRSTNGGATWRPASNGLPTDMPANTGVSALIAAPTQPGVLFAALDGEGVWRSADGGDTWTSFAGGSVPATASVAALALDPRTPSILYALTEDGVHASVDGGTWRKRVSGLPDPTAVIFSDLALDPSDPDILYAATSPEGIFVTQNGGKTWTSANGNLPDGPRNLRDIALHPSNGDVFVSLRGAGLFRSPDGGKTWVLSQAGITYNHTLFGTVSAPAISPVDPLSAYVYNADGVFHSEDGGATWAAVTGLDESLTVTTLAAHSTLAPMVYAGTSVSGLWTIRDGAGADSQRLYVPLIRK